jgi:hypothetical protein
MKRFHARVEVVKKLKELGLYIEAKDNPMPIPICRCVRRVDLREDARFNLHTVSLETSLSPCSSPSGG